MATAAKIMGALITIAVAVGIGGAAYNQFSGGAGRVDEPVEIAARDEAIELAQVEVTTVERIAITDEIRISGVLNPVRRTSVTAEIGGRIETLDVEVGDSVAAGDVLVELDTDALEATQRARQASLEATQAQLSLAETTLERNRRLGQSGIASEAAILEAEASVLNLRAQARALEADLEQAALQLTDATIRAPFDGVVSARPVEQGQTVGANTEVLALVDMSRLEAAVGVPTSRIANVSVGQAAQLSIDGFSDETFLARVARISPVAEAGSRAVRVFLEMDNPDERLRGGMFATGTLRTDDFPDVIALPQSAVRTDEGGAYVLKAEDGRLVRQNIEPGQVWADRGLVEVSGGLEVGDLVVTAPLPDLQPDVEVRIAEI